MNDTEIIELLNRIADALEGIEYSLKKIEDGRSIVNVEVDGSINAKCSGVVYDKQ